MDIRTLLTETKPSHPKRKTDSIVSSPTPSEHSMSNIIANTLAPTMFEDTRSHEHQAPVASLMGVPKKVKFTLSEATSPLGPRSFSLNISPSDPPSAITATVKDFFALHNCGVSFTDENGSILIITPDNLYNDMEVIVNQIGVNELEDQTRKKRKIVLSSRKKTRKLSIEKSIVEVEFEGESEKQDRQEKKEKVLSSEVSIDNILFSSRRRLTKFSSENLPLIPQNPVQQKRPSNRKGATMIQTGPREGIFVQQTLPTPTPTSASVISDEDVAIQLMRLTDPLATPILSPSVAGDEEHEEESYHVPGDDNKEHNRCTRCIASKKGCDRKRPCGRCEQHGLKEWECTSDDEKGSARKKVAALRRKLR